MQKLSVTDFKVIRAVTTRPEISYNMTVHKDWSTAVAVLERKVREATAGYGEDEKALVYCRTRETADAVAALLGCKAFHKGFTNEELVERLTKFRNDPREKVLVATSVLGVGFDLAHVRNVYHIGLAWSLIAWMQEAGRAGRDGEKASSHMLTWRDEIESHPETMGYTEDTLRTMAVDRDRCRRMTIGHVLDGKSTSCVQLRGVNLCDNCKRALATEHPPRQATASRQADVQERNSLQNGRDLRPETSSTRPERSRDDAGIDPSPTSVQSRRVSWPERNARPVNAPERYRWLNWHRACFFLTRLAHNTQALRIHH